ncbi:hypothetical protein [Aliarcobacter skirrowii]|uniref:hypothetical protein n=1 Tax=Aliarcobacter skirrowii TaxID=28200 RepID=UPI0029AFB69F|nr:hypothetical protein [Aliarcobacter skirrowii]MDX4037868.1 hypothetical protein [Aliarcobacter skirrowii]
MIAIEYNDFFSSLCEEYNIKLPNNLQNREIYKEIENFREAEYIYCIAYEMLIRTDEYNRLIEEYKPLKNKSKYDMTNEEFLKLRELIRKMNQLGLKKTSFLGFDNENDYDHVFKMIEYYDEVSNSPWNVKKLDKFEIEPSLGYKSIYHMLIDFYNKKNQLYKLKNGEYKKIHLKRIEEYKSKEINFINDIHITEIYKYINILFIPDVTNEKIIYKALKDIIYLNQLDKDFLKLLKEKKSDNLLIKTKSDFTKYNIEFWNKFYVNDIKDGFNKLIKFHLKHNSIYDKNSRQINVSFKEIVKNPSNFYIPCVNRNVKNTFRKWYRENNSRLDDTFINNLKFDGIKSIFSNEGYIRTKKEENIYLVQLNEYISLGLLENLFLKTLTYEDLKNIYIDTEPKFSRPRLMFDEARLTNIPINLNLSKEDLVHYISQIKDEYDKDKSIVKTFDEYFFDLPLESDLIEKPTYLKYASEKRSSEDKKILPVKRDEFKKRIAYAFHIYDIFKFFIPYTKEKINDLREKRKDDIKKEKDAKGIYHIDHNKIENIKENAKINLSNYTHDSLITQISSLFQGHLSKKQVEYYLTIMKEFIHGINLKGENNVLKKAYNPEVNEKGYPKYKDLIIGNSYFTKSNKAELIKKLID